MSYKWQLKLFATSNLVAKRKKKKKTETFPLKAAVIESKTWVIRNRLSLDWIPECLHMGERETLVPILAWGTLRQCQALLASEILPQGQMIMYEIYFFVFKLYTSAHRGSKGAWFGIQFEDLCGVKTWDCSCFDIAEQLRHVQSQSSGIFQAVCEI